MSIGRSITGVVGHIKWGWNPAAAINGYTVTVTKHGVWSLRATVINANAFNLTQRPLVFVAPHEKGEWVWRLRAVRFVDSNGFTTTIPRAPFALHAELAAPDLKQPGVIYVGSVLPVRSA